MPCSSGAIPAGAFAAARALLDRLRGGAAPRMPRRSGAASRARSATTSRAGSRICRRSRATTSGCPCCGCTCRRAARVRPPARDRAGVSRRAPRGIRRLRGAVRRGAATSPAVAAGGGSLDGMLLRRLPAARRARARAHRPRRRLPGEPHAPAVRRAAARRSSCTPRCARARPCPYNLYLDGGGFQLAGREPGDVPARATRTARSRRARSRAPRPLETTRLRDRALAAALAASPKDRAENTMIVDLARNDLSRVCLAGQRPRVAALRGRGAPDGAPDGLDRRRSARVPASTRSTRSRRRSRPAR